jgi:Family of unknown function (DUF6056)
LRTDPSVKFGGAKVEVGLVELETSSIETVSTAKSRTLTGVSVISTLAFAVAVGLTLSTRRQISDDWTFAMWFREKGVFGLLLYGYTHFSGRIPLLLLGGWLSTLPTGLALALLLLALFALGGGIRRLLTGLGVPNRNAAVFAALLVIGVVAGAPARNQAVFWTIGALVYLVPATLFVGALCFLLFAKNRSVLFVLAGLCGFLAASGNEVQAVIAPFVMMILVGVKAKRSSLRRCVREVCVLGCTGLGGLALIGAPGNGNRSKMLIVSVKHDADTVFSSSIKVLNVLTINLLAAGLVPAVTIAIAGILVGRSASDSRPSLQIAARVAGATAILAVLTFCFVSAWGFNASAPLRAMFPVWLALASFLFLGSASIGSRAMASRRQKLTPVGGVPGFGVFALAAPAFVLFTVAQGLPRDRALARQLDCIEKSVEDSGAAGATIAAPQQADSLLILEDSPKSDTNKSVADRFGSGPITRVRPGLGNKCEAEATTLLKFLRSSDFGPELPKA